MTHGNAREGKWRGNWQMKWVASTLHTTSEHGVSNFTIIYEYKITVKTQPFIILLLPMGYMFRLSSHLQTLHRTDPKLSKCIVHFTIFTIADAHIAAATNWLKWRTHRFKWTRPFRRKTKSDFCACAITFQTQSTTCTVSTGTASCFCTNTLTSVLE